MTFIEMTSSRVRLLRRTAPRHPQRRASHPQRTFARASIKLPTRRPPRILPLLRLLFRLVRVKPAFFAPPDSTVRPQTLEDHFRRGGRSRRIFTVLNAQPPD